jgi:hypothetical protein
MVKLHSRVVKNPELAVAKEPPPLSFLDNEPESPEVIMQRNQQAVKWSLDMIK